VTTRDTTYQALMASAEDTSLRSRNHNDELIGIDFCQQLDALSNEQVTTLEQAWNNKRRQALKEKISAQFMIVQLTLLMLVAAISAWFIGGIIGMFTSLIGLMGLFIVIDSKRVTDAKKNLSDAERVYSVLSKTNQSSPY